MTAPVVETLVAPIIKVNGQDLGAVALNCLSGMRISRSMRLPARCVLQFDDAGFALSAGTGFAVGTEIKVIAGSTVLIAGQVTGIDLDIDRGVPSLAVQVDDLAFKLTLGSKVRTFTNVTYSNVISTIARENGLTAQVGSSRPLTTQLEYLLQSDTDFGFIDEIAERTGCDWWVLENTLHFGPPAEAAPVATLEMGENLLRFSLRANALHPMKATVRGWSQKLKQEVVGIVARTTVPLPTSAAVQGHLQQTLRPAAEVITSSSTPMDVAEAQSIAGQLAASWRLGAVTARGSARISPVISARGRREHRQRRPGLRHLPRHRGRAHATRPVASKPASPQAIGRRPGWSTVLGGGAATSSFRQLGLVVGVVTAVGDTRNSDLSKVKVKFTALGDVESGWARVVSVGGGARRGVTFMPEINDEVLVGFEGGDVRRPLVIGGLFNGRDVADEFGVANNKVEKRRITSRLGHFVELGDGTAPAAQHIALMLAGGAHTVRLGKDKLTAEVPSGTPVTIKSGTASFDISDSGAITISGTKITLKAQQDVTIEGLNITTKAKVKAATSATMFEATATATAKVSASGPLVLGGAIVKVN